MPIDQFEHTRIIIIIIILFTKTKPENEIKQKIFKNDGNDVDV